MPLFKRLDIDASSGSKHTVSVTINGELSDVFEGETVAAAILIHGMKSSRTTPISNAPRAPFCMMGVCFECLVVINGLPNQQACVQRVQDGMVIERQVGVGE